MKNERYVISLGGSIIVPDKIDAKFLRNFRKLILEQTKRGRKFLILPGGGSTARAYQQAARLVGNVSDDGLDWIGIEVNRLHAHMMRWILGARKYAPVWTLKTLPKNLKDPIISAVGAIKPGGSSDSASIRFAMKMGIDTVINLTNVGGVFDRDPSKFESAKLIPSMTWKEFRIQFGTSRSPGQHKPFDSSAAKMAEKAGIKVVVVNGRDLKNLKNYFSGRKFKGTVIQG